MIDTMKSCNLATMKLLLAVLLLTVMLCDRI
jgi:hypothetical protein